jgi:mannan polymerase II complex MNN11 subunit
MHFALPPRKTSHPPPYVRNSNLTAAAQRRRKQIQFLAYAVLGLLTLYLVIKAFLSFRTADGQDNNASSIEGPQDIVIVTVFDHATMSEDYMGIIKANRGDYAARHGKCANDCLVVICQLIQV